MARPRKHRDHRHPVQGNGESLLHLKEEEPAGALMYVELHKQTDCADGAARCPVTQISSTGELIPEEMLRTKEILMIRRRIRASVKQANVKLQLQIS